MIALKRRMRLGRTAAVLLLFSLGATSQVSQPTFEVSSVKLDASGQPGPQYRMFPGFSVQRATLKDLVTMAYRVHDFQVSGGPAWINSDRYNIEAKSDPVPAFSQEYRMLQLSRLQSLLAERFGLAIHRETKQLPVYELTVAKGGHKLQAPNCIGREAGDNTIAPGKTMIDYCGFGGFSRRGLYQASDGSTEDLAGALSFVLGRSVVNKTGVAGRFRIVLTFSGYSAATPLPDAGTPSVTPATDLGPDIFTALQEQLGLKLESAKGPVEVIVIDRVEKPSEN